MPELPEVETVTSILNTFLPGCKIFGVQVFKKNIVKNDVETFKKTLTGQTFSTVKRKGKQIIFTFESDLILLSHLRMEGKFIEIRKGESFSRYAHVVFDLGDGHYLCYDDSRQFGTMELSTADKYEQTKTMLNIGPEPFDINKEQYFRTLTKKNGIIKPLLLDQKLMSGLGNIYVDEVLFLSKISPTFPSSKLTQEQVNTIVDNAVIVLNNAINAGGSTIRSYHPANGISGNFQVSLNIYGKANEKCPVCKTKFKKIFVRGRGTTYCPFCQRNPFKPVVIAITGQKASGKSELLKYIASKGEKTYQADIIAKDLYKDSEIVYELEQLLKVNLMSEGNFDKDKLRRFLIENPKKIKELNAYIHPLVKNKIEEIIANSTEKKLYFEVPLVFSHKVNELFDYIVGVETTVERQLDNIAKRGDSLAINADKMYFNNRHLLDYIIINNGSFNQMYEVFDSFKF